MFRLAGGWAVVFSLGVGLAAAQAIHGRDGIELSAPPEAAVIPVTDNYFGTGIRDNYRWLEETNSPETRAFIAAENGYTESYFRQDRIRPQVEKGLAPLVDVPEWSMPVERGGAYFFLKRMAGEQQASIYTRRGWNGKDERLIDPGRLGQDPNTSVGILNVSRDGSLLAYHVRRGGADEASVHVVETGAGRILDDELPAARYFSVDFTPDGQGLYYTRSDQGGTLLYEHVLGTRSSADKLLLGHTFHGEPLGPDDLFSAWVTDDGHYLVVQIDRGVPATRVDIAFRDLRRRDTGFELLVWGIDARFTTTYAQGGWYVQTDYRAPKGAILKAEPGRSPDGWKTVVPEAADAIEDFSIVGGKLYVERLKDVKSETCIYTLEGKPAGRIAYEEIGSATGLAGRTTDRYGYFIFSSFIVPPTIYRLDTVTGKRAIFARPRIPFDSSQYELTQIFYRSKDGTRVPMFIAGKKGLRRDGSERLLMTGYGGFDISMTPGWNPAYAWWLEQGGWFALPSLRGGGEYGEAWHEQGMFGKKQNVFDDWFAAAAYLIANRYTSPQHFAITGRSNGGLLMGASMTQRPELYSAILCGYPLLDMLRFQKFLVGSYWVTEYGSSGNERQFAYLHKYSPYQNVKAGTAYPAVLFFTGDSDTRVAPLHARKMTALMQASSSSGRPILLHYSLAGGHSAGVGVDQQIRDDADQLAFLWTETGAPAPPR